MSTFTDKLRLNNFKVFAIFAILLICVVLQPLMVKTAHAAGNELTDEEILLQETVQGSVSDAQTGEPLPGVNIIVQGTSNGTSTDSDGIFSLEVDNLNAVLVISFVGYEQKILELNGRNEIDIELQLGTLEADELVVIGYGEQRQRDLTGAITTVRSDDLENQTVTSPDQLLQGKIPGVQVTNSSGQPGAATNILIRGGSSINAGNLPLFVVDGIPVNMSAGKTSILNGAPISPLANINSNDIASISVLKDASATAIYGARASGGVVIVTTKKGVSGKPQVSYSGSYGTQFTPELYPVLNATEYAEFRNEALTNDGLDPFYTDQETRALGEGTDWQDEVYQTGNLQKHNLSVVGGSENTQYFVSGGYNFIKGTVIKSDFENLNFRVNLNTNINERIRIGNNFTASRINSNIIKSSENTGGSLAGVIRASLVFNPTIPVYDDDGSYNLINEPGGQGNPVATAKDITNQTEKFNFQNNLYGEIDITDGLAFRTDLGININNTRENFFRPSFIQIISPNNEASVARLDRTNWVSNSILRYEKEFRAFGSVPQSFDITLGFTRENTSREYLIGSAEGFPVNELEYYNLSAGEQFSSPSTFEESSDLVSYLTRINYQLNNKFLFTFTGRIDGSSRFGSGNKYGFFPSGAIAWNMAEEGFINEIDLINELKLRLSYGVTGNQEIGNYQALSLMETGSTIINDNLQNAVFPVNLSNPDLKWETTNQFNAGIDATAFNNRFSFTADFYNKITSDILLNTPLPYTTGFEATTINLGDMRNRGVEFGLQANRINTGNLFVSAGFNIAFNDNEITSLGGLEPFFAGGGQRTSGGDNNLIIQEGFPVGSFYGLKNDGLFQNEGEVANSAQPDARPGDERFVDINNDGNINADDRTVIGSAQPDFTGGFSTNLFYKGFELSMIFNFVYGNDIFNGNRYDMERMNGQKNSNRAVLDRWTPENRNTPIPRASISSQQRFSDRFIEDGSYIRLQNMTFAYNLPQRTLSGLNLSNIRLHVRGENLLLLTNYSGFDPDVNAYGQDFLSQGIDVGVYPKSRMITAGVEIDF